jgi:xanthine dehydrogenase accessory factor
MKEIRDILLAFERAQKEGQRSALATVVHVEGSAYRRPGARMLVTDDGQLTGAISGGCLEGDALRKALLAIHQQQNKLVTYDTTNEDDLQFGIQLGCNGIVHILFEPIDTRQPYHPLALLRELAAERRNAVLATLFSLDRGHEQPGTCLLFTGEAIQTSLTDHLRSAILADVENAFGQAHSFFAEYVHDGPDLKGFIEFIPPPPSLVIAGAGNDVVPLVEIAAMLGWETTVVDGRPQYATAERFKKAGKVVVSKAERILEQVDTDEQTLFVLMTHNYNYDLSLLRELMKAHYPYIGLLGPRKKLERMLEALSEEGINPDEKQLAALHGPVGLDIGAETAQEIAVSIIAEIKALLTGRHGGPLKDCPVAIHHRPGLISTHG